MRTERENEILAELEGIIDFQRAAADRTHALLTELCQIQTTKLDSKDDEIEEALRRWWHRPLGLTKEITGWRFGPVKEM